MKRALRARQYGLCRVETDAELLCNFLDAEAVNVLPLESVAVVRRQPVERYTRTDAGTLENVITITDPGAYKKPFTVKFTATLRPGWDLMEYICNENNQDVEQLKGPAGL